jgi:hypothetical protein
MVDASQKDIESFTARLRRATQKQREVRNVLKYAHAVEKLFNNFALTPGEVFSICGLGQTHWAQPPSAGTLSAELVEGDGERISCAGEEFHFPACQSHDRRVQADACL